MQLSGATYTQSRLPSVASDTRAAAAIDANRSMRQGNLTIRLIEYLVFWDDFSFNLLPVADIVMKLSNSSEGFQNGYVVHTCIPRPHRRAMFQTSVRRHQLRIATLWVWGGMSAVAQLACCSEIRKMWCVKSGWSIVESTIDPKVTCKWGRTWGRTPYTLASTRQMVVRGSTSVLLCYVVSER